MMQAYRVVKTALVLKLLLSQLASATTSNDHVTVQPLGAGCASYPDYDESTGLAGPWPAVVDAPGTDIDGFSFRPVFATAVGGGRWGFVSAWATYLPS